VARHAGFLGEVEVDVTGELADRLRRAGRRHPPLRLSFGGAAGSVTACCGSGVQGQLDGLRRLVESVRAGVRRAGLPADERLYRPHLTLASAAGAPTDLRPLVNLLASFEGRPWTTSSCTWSAAASARGRAAPHHTTASPRAGSMMTRGRRSTVGGSRVLSLRQGATSGTCRSEFPRQVGVGAGAVRAAGR
jgi:hypothetical protein